MLKQNNLLIFILALGTFSILNTEVGIIGILPLIADNFQVSLSQAGLLVSSFSLIIAISGIIMPLIFSRFNRKYVMLMVLGIFILGNMISMIAPNFYVALLGRTVPAFFHPIYCSLAFVVAASIVEKEKIPQAVSKIMMGVSAGIVIGIPITNFIAYTFSYQYAMLFFTIVNIIAFVLTMIFVPSMPVENKISYGSQLLVLKKSITWISLSVTTFIGAGLFSAYAYIAQYLQEISLINEDSLSLILFLFGISSILGNYIAGKLLVKNSLGLVILYPVVFSIVYLLIFNTGSVLFLVIPLVLIWGILNGIGNNIQQYWIVSAIPQAPDFANGLFISFGNLGTTIGTFIGGMILTQLGIHYIVFGGIVFFILTFMAVIFRVKFFAVAES